MLADIEYVKHYLWIQADNDNYIVPLRQYK